MSVHLVGGGWNPAHDSSVFGPFVAETTARASSAGRDVPLIAVVSVRETDAAEHAEKLVAAIGAAGQVSAVVAELAHGDVLLASAISGFDGIVVGGGHTPSYLAAVMPVADDIRREVIAGVPYLGFSAGSAIASTRAIVGGWRMSGLEVSPEDGSEDLDEVTVLPGLGFIGMAIDVHAVQWGNLSRLIAVVMAGEVEEGVAIDESTTLIIGPAATRVVGAGSAWHVTRTDSGATIETLRA